MEPLLADLIRVGVPLSLIAYIWKRMEKDVVSIMEAIKTKADKTSTTEIESRVMREFEKTEARQTRLEERQARDVESMREEIGKMNARLDSMQVNMSDGFNQVISLLVKK